MSSNKQRSSSSFFSKDKCTIVNIEEVSSNDESATTSTDVAEKEEKTPIVEKKQEKYNFSLLLQQKVFPHSSGSSLPVKYHHHHHKQLNVECIPPDGGWGWVIVIAAFLIFFITDGTILAFGILLQEMADTFHCLKSEVANANAVKTAIFCFQGPISAALVNKYGFRTVALIGSIIGMLGHVGTALSPNLIIAILSTGLIGGIGFGMIYISAIIALGFYFEKWRSLATGLAVCGAGVGTIVTPFLINYSENTLGWRNTFYILAVITTITIPASLVLKPLHVLSISTKDDERDELTRTTTTATINSIHSTKKSANQISNFSFFNKYNNKNYPTLSEIKSESVINVIQYSSKPSITTTTREYKTSIKFPDTEEVLYYQSNEEILNKRFLFCNCCCCICLHNKKTRRQGRVLSERNCCSKRKKVTISFTRPMYRDDIMSDLLIHHNHSADYRKSITRVMTDEDLEDDLKCRLFPEAVKRVLATMLDFRLIKNKAFCLLSMYQLFLSMGYYIPFMFLVDKGLEQGIEKDKLIGLISILGVTNCIGRAVSGLFVSINIIGPLMLTCVCLTVGGIATLMSGFFCSSWYQYLYASMYGFTIACPSTLRTVLIIEAIGLENLTNGTGINFIFRGMGNLIGILIGGQLVNLTNSYSFTFYFSGIVIIISAFFVLLSNIVISRIKQTPIWKQ